MSESRARPVRTSGDLLINGGPSTYWPGGGEVGPTQCDSGGCGQCPACLVWAAGPGQGQAVGGSHFNIGYGYFGIGPNGPDRGNLPGPLPQGAWWNTTGQGGAWLPSVTRATQLIVGPVVGTRWRLSRYGEPGELNLPQWIYAPMLAGKTFGTNRPLFPSGMRLNSTEFWSTVVTHALWWGRGAFTYLEDSEGQPSAGTLRILNPFLIGRSEDGRVLLDAFGDDPLVADFDGGVRIGSRRWMVKILRGMPPHDADDQFGGVLVRHAAALGIGAHIQSYARNVFHQGVPSGFLKVSQPNLTKESADGLRSAWMAAHGGDRRAVAVLNSTVDYSPISWSPVETDLDKAKKLNLMDIAHAFGLSSAWLDTGADSLTYANVSDRRRDLVDHTLKSVGGGLMEALTTILPAGQRLEIAWVDYTAGNTEERLRLLLDALNAGVMTVDEVRDEMKLPPMGGPDAR